MKFKIPRKTKKELKRRLAKGTGFKMSECKIDSLSTETRHLLRCKAVYKGVAVNGHSMGFPKPWNKKHIKS